MSGYTKAVRERRWWAMLQCFVDDSGSDPRPEGLFILAGYVMEHRRWEEFAEKWELELNRFPAIAHCKMTDAENGEGLFRGVDRLFRQLKVRKLATVISEAGPIPVACCMRWDDYNSVVKGKVPPGLDNPYAVLFFKIMRIISELQLAAQIPENTGYNHVDFIFDEQDSAGFQALRWYEVLRERVGEPHRTMIANTPLFRDDRLMNPLQAADMLAWHIRRHFAYPDENRADVFGLLQPQGEVWQYDVQREELADLARAFNSGGLL
jgi:hypothetical protein